MGELLHVPLSRLPSERFAEALAPEQYERFLGPRSLMQYLDLFCRVAGPC